MTTFLITGASGFVGRHLIHEVERRGDTVWALDRSTDVRSDEFGDEVRRLRPDVVIHLAALSSVADSWSQREEFEDVNVRGTQRVLEALARYRPDSRCLVVSSAEVYGVVTPDDVPLAESAPLRPANPYAESKARAEDVARGFVDELDVIILRPFTHTGPGQSTRFVVPALASRLLKTRELGESEIAVGDLRARRDFSDVRDVVRAYLDVAHRGRPGATYNVSSDVDRSIGEIADQLRLMIAPGVAFRTDASLLRPLETPILVGDSSALREATGWQPSVEWSRTLRDVVEDLQRRRVGLDPD